MSGFYIGVDGKARKVKGAYIGVDGVVRKIKKGYIGDENGIARLCWTSLEMPPIGKSLNDCTWEEISLIASKGKARDYFSIGDTKTITVKGTVGTVAADKTLQAYIIGFDHNGAKNAIDFGLFKDTDGKDLAFSDENYQKYSTNGTKYYNMNHSDSTNAGGWKGCDLRYDVLGSTDVNDGDASATCATKPVANTFMAALPTDLREVMKPMTIYTDNTGGTTNADANVTASVDYLPLLSEFEVFGTRTNANSAEQRYQKQYEYFANGNSKIKYRALYPMNDCKWWNRSPGVAGDTYFCEVDLNGRADRDYARLSNGIAPIFRV